MVKGRRVRNGLIGDDSNKLAENNQISNYQTTPILTAKMTLDMKSPPTTPHRIELFCTTEENNGILPKVEDTVVVVTNKANKRRLNNNQTINHQPPTNLSMMNNSNNNHKLTEYFPVRRSIRKTKKTVLEEKQRTLEQLLRNQIEIGLEVRHFDEKGRGVIASKNFNRGDFVVEYSGDLIDLNEAKIREQIYAQDQNAGCYMYYFKHNNQQYCIDATAETGRLGRLVNHSRNGNLITRTICVDNKPRLVLIAKDIIKIGEEVTYDYGDRSKESLKHHPWLAN